VASPIDIRLWPRKIVFFLGCSNPLVCGWEVAGPAKIGQGAVGEAGDSSRGFNKFFYDRFRNSHGNRPLCRGSGRASDSLQVGRLLGNDRRKHSFCSMVVCVDLCLGAHTDDCDPSGDVALVYLVYRSTWASRWASIAPLPMVNRIPRGGGENEGGEMCPGRWSQHPQSGTGLRVRSLRACLAAPPVDQLECPPW
jgi:hypothetical protein